MQRDERGPSHKHSLLGQIHSETNLMPVKSSIKSQRSKRIRGWKKSTTPVTLGACSATATMDSHPYPPAKGAKSKETPRDRSVMSKSIIQTTPEDEDKKLARFTSRGVEEITAVRRSHLDDRESPRPVPAPSPAIDPENLYQSELRDQIARWSQELSVNLQNELQRRYIVYEETISKLRSQIAADQAGLDQLEEEEAETRRLAPRLTALSYKVQGETHPDNDPLETNDSESIDAQILALQQEIISIESQNEMLRSDVLKARASDDQLPHTNEDAALQLSSARHNWRESERLVQELRNAEGRLSKAAADLEIAEGHRRQLYEELTRYQTEAKLQERLTVSSRLEHSIPLEPRASLIESRLVDLLDSHNIMLALETRDVQTEHGQFDILQNDWQQYLDRYSDLWQAESHSNLDAGTEAEMANELLQTISDQTESVLGHLLKNHEQLLQKRELTLQEIQDVLSSCVPGQNAERSSRRSTSESELFCITSAQKDVAEFDPKT